MLPLVLIAALAGCGTGADRVATPVADARYVGGEACRSCHEQVYAAWRPSQHAGAMKHAADSTVLGDFNNARFTDGGVTTRFSRRDGQFVVNTEGPDGKLHDYVIKYTFGLYPLQQYLIDLDNGRIQALTIAWDARPKVDGGQRWFTLYPNDRVRPGESIHWTGRDQNWNFMCAECHSTNVQKNYDPTQPRFTTSWTDISVSCEACHGPGSRHIEWAQKGGKPGKGAEGLVVDFDERRGVTWPIDQATGIGVRSAPRRTDKEVNTCGLCHARRAQLRDGYVPGQPLGTTEQVALLEPRLFWPDGQMRDEVYNYAPFLQSRMYHQGVTCSDCHEPHSQQLRAPGAKVCLNCHAPQKYEGPAHDFHPAGARGVDCVSCHMPMATYMVIDQRHDHSLRIPRPDLTERLGVPNTCTQCHKDKPASWAAAQVVAWYGKVPEGYQRYAETFYNSEAQLPGSLSRLTGLAGDSLQPAIARATAVSRLAGYQAPAAVSAAELVAADANPLLRAAAVSALENTDPATRTRVLGPRLRDSVLEVRIGAARALAGVSLPEQDREAFGKALQEYIDVQMFSADRPESWTNLAGLYAQLHDRTRAMTAFGRALALDSAYVPAWVNMADYLRSIGEDGGAQAALESGLRKAPDAATLHYALGLTFIRQKQLPQALSELKAAAQLAPDDPGMSYVYAVALHDTGKPAEAIALLERTLAKHPQDRSVLEALVAYYRQSNDLAKATAASAALQELTAKGP